MKAKKSIVFFLNISFICSTFSCSLFYPNINTISEQKAVPKVISNNSNNIVIDAGYKNGTTLSTAVNLDNFNVKNSTPGANGKAYNNIASYKVYLLKRNSATYPTNGVDPEIDAVLGFPLTVDKTPSNPVAGGGTHTITITNVPASGIGYYYYIALRAYDGSSATGNQLIEPNINWTSANKQIAVSSGSGAQVDTSLVITPASALNISVNLLNTLGAKLGVQITHTTNGNTNYDGLVSGYLNLGNLDTVAGNGTFGIVLDSVSALANNLTNGAMGTEGPAGITTDKYGNIYFGTIDNPSRLRVISFAGEPNFYNPAIPSSGNMSSIVVDTGSAIPPHLQNIKGLSYSPLTNTIYLANTTFNRISKVDLTSYGSFTDIVNTAGSPGGTAGFSGDTGSASAAQVNAPTGVFVNVENSADIIYIADTNNQRIRKIDNLGNINTIAGSTTVPGFAGDGNSATVAELNTPTSVVLDSVGNVYIADKGNARIRKIDKVSGNISTIAGNGTPTPVTIGATATSSSFEPYSLAVDSNDDLFIGDITNCVVLKYNKNTNDIIKVLGSAGNCGDVGENISASDVTVRINQPYGIAIDTAGSIYISDFSSSKIKRVTR